VIVVSESQKPPDDAMYGGIYEPNWERGLDPWHRDAFPEEFKKSAPNQSDTRRSGWFLIDHCGNTIGFVPDGMRFEEEEK